MNFPELRGVISPAIVEHSGTLHVEQDEGIVMLCIAQSCPSPDYRWFTFSGAEPVLIIPGPKTHLLGPILALEAVTQEDSGIYRCSASNVGGEASAELRLVVVTSLHVEVSPSVLSVHIGGTAEFKCNGQYNRPYMISWFKDGMPLPGTGRHNSDHFVLRGVTRDDRGMYQCIVRRSEGDTAQSSGELQLGDTPPSLLYSFIEQTLQPGPPVSLKCSAAGNPTPQIIWTLDGFPLPNNGRFVIGQYMTVHGDVISHVNISQVAVEDGGEYTCVAENRAGKVSHSARLNVYGLPYIRLIPKITAIAGETLRLKCPVAGFPIEEIHWERGGKLLPVEIRQNVESDGTLVIMSVQKETDVGVYSCWAKNKQGKSARRSAEVAVIVPPIIEPFSFQDGLSEGMRTRTVCGVSQGDPPLTITWLKDGGSLPPHLGANYTTLDAYSSLLSIPSLTSLHSGDYTCVASNPVAELRYTAKLLVKVPPRWTIEPNSEISVERNRHVMLHCQAEGVPKPNIVWKKATSGGKSGEYEEVRERIHTKIFSNGSLLLQNIKEDKEGLYMCQANNGIGNPIGKMVQLKVNSSPYFSTPSKQVTVKKGDVAVLQCDVKGDKPITISWLKNGNVKLTPQNNYRISVKQDLLPEGVMAEIRITGSDSSDSGAYFCQASNVYGREQQMVQLFVQEPPQSPSELEIVSINSRSVNLQWKRPSDGNAEISKYIIQFKEDDVTTTWQNVEVGIIPSAIIEDLKPDTKYLVRVIAEGTAGRSIPSEPLLIKTEPQRPAGAPLHINVRPMSSTEILVSWSPPLFELRHGKILGYNVGIKEASSASATYSFTNINGDGEEGGELLLTGLSKFTRYSIVIRAFNEIGSGPLSEPILTQTLEDVPSMAPEDVRCSVLSPQSLQLSWLPPAPAHSNGILQGYKVHIEPLHDDVIYDNDEFEPRKTTSLTMVISGLKKFTNYSIQLLAYTRVGDGILSKPTYCQTEEDVPGPPSDIKVVVKSSDSLLVSWLPPKEPNGIITKYNLYMRTDNPTAAELHKNKHYVPTQHTLYEVKNLRTQVEYQFYVTASTKIGEGQSSRLVTQLPNNRVPARIASFGGPVVFPRKSSATLSCDAVGQPEPKMEWFKNDQLLKFESSKDYQILDSGEIILTNLQPEDTGNYTCRIDNLQSSDRITYYLVVQVPPSPPVLYVTSATSSSILFHWKAGSSGGAIITSFLLYYSRDHSDPEEVILSRRITSYELKNLSCGSTYHLFLIAQNKIGKSPQSSTLSVRTQGEPPGVPQGTALIQPNSTSVLLRLHVWPDSGCPLLYFVIQYRSNTDTLWILVTSSLKPQKRFTISGLKPLTVYQLKIEAHNIAGSSMAEFTFITLTKDGDPPPPELVTRTHPNHSLLNDFRFLVPLFLAFAALLAALVATVFCWRNNQGRPLKESLDNQHNSEAQRERYYATIHKVPLQISNEKIPETSEDISPYATFQLSETGAPTTAMLHSFMYHEQALTEGCNSPPPPPPLGIKMSERRRSRSRSRKREADSDGSDSDNDQLTSSRTESSNQLDTSRLKQSYLYHGPHSSTSSDISLMSEVKSLPRRGRNSKTSLRSLILPPISTAETSFNGLPPDSLMHPPDRHDIRETECDIDTMKKVKMGLRSSLWSRPSGLTKPTTDYSIAV
ncbi:down syndrome cell adhesion molecule, putative [Pediculus humanus corporis]|uniref:Down syndrome cell adhesion molecule, putative n=1 Tax=Pediculus humanus subsp. corporis TaxID=121224 RepID=E0VT58_PEDHC|nr:down syndrome cell adhesion molecule, putative [Pediculus humanus corporis]EEB16564.1 down syndrome cell adhesion molecule, putative [Pediculus humanus corporis]